MPPLTRRPRRPRRPRQLQLPLSDLEQVAPVRVRRINGDLRVYPDLAHFMPSRIVTRAEAVSNGWPLYYEARVCGAGHLAPRYVAGHGMRCVDCGRAKEGRPLIGLHIVAADAAEHIA